MKCVMSQMTALYISAHFTEREGDQAGTVAEDRRQREQMLALSQVEADRLSSIIVLEKDRE